MNMYVYMFPNTFHVIMPGINDYLYYMKSIENVIWFSHRVSNIVTYKNLIKIPLPENFVLKSTYTHEDIMKVLPVELLL